ALQDGGGPEGDPAGPHSAAYQRGRAAAAPQRAPRGDVPGRAAAAAALRGRSVRGAPLRPPGHDPRHHGTVAGGRKESHDRFRSDRPAREGIRPELGSRQGRGHPPAHHPRRPSNARGLVREPRPRKEQGRVAVSVVDQLLLSALNLIIGAAFVALSPKEEYGHYVLVFGFLLLLAGIQ